MTLRSKLVVFVGMTVLAVICHSHAAAETVTVAGTVLAPDGRPAAGVSVFAQWFFSQPPGRHPLITAAATSGADGGFSLVLEGDGQALERGTVDAVEEGSGFGWASVKLADTQHVVVRLNEATVVAGTVRDAAGEPVAEADVHVVEARGEDGDHWLAASDRFHATTGADGRFELPGMPVGKQLRLYVRKEGCIPEDTNRQPAELMTDLEVTLHPDAAVAGRVTRAGEPVPGVTVWCKAQPPGHERGVGATDADGHYVAREMPGGRYDVYLHAPDGWAATVHRDVSCVAGQTVGGVDFELVAGGVVTGTVRDRNTGESVGRAGMTAYMSRSDFPSSGFWHSPVDEAGRYSLCLPPGEYVLHVDARSCGYAYRGEEPWLHEVEVAAGQTVEDFDIPVTLEASVAGIVVDAAGVPVAGASIRLSGSSRVGVVTDERGRFADVSHSGSYPTVVAAFDGARGLCGLVVPQAQTPEIRIVMTPGSYVRARLADPDGEGIKAVNVACRYTCWHGDGSASGIYAPKQPTDADGYVRLGPLPAGVELRTFIYGNTGQYVAATDWPEEFTLGVKEERDLGTATVDMAGRFLSGRVLDVDRNPVAGCVVVDLASEAVARSDEQGAFKITGLPLWVWASSPPRSYVPILIAAHLERGMYATEVGPDHAWGFETLMVLEPLGEVTGRLVDKAGQAIVGQRVELQPHDVPYVSMPEQLGVHAGGARLRAETFTDDEGRWHFTGLLPGLDYVVVARDTGEGRPPVHFSESIITEPGRTMDLGDVASEVQ